MLSRTHWLRHVARLDPETEARSPAGMSAPSRIAVTGETRVARSAGPRPASTVTTMPTASETMTVRAPNTVLVDGSSMPTDANTPLRSFARPMPATSPIAEATVPTARASATTRSRVSRGRRSWPSSVGGSNHSERALPSVAAADAAVARVWGAGCCRCATRAP